MIYALAQQATRQTKGALLAAALLIAALVPSRATAQCPVSESYFLFGHSHFRGTHWMRTLQEHQVSIADSVCSLDIADAAFAGTDTANYAVIATHDGPSYLLRMVRRPRSFFCGLPSLNLETPRALGLDIPAGTPFALVNHESYRRDSLLLAVAVAPLRVRVYTVETAVSRITDSTDIVLSDAGGQQIRAIAGDADTLGGADNGLWVAGDAGLIRHVAFDGATWSGEQTYDIGGSISVLCIGEGYAGCDNGTVFALSGGAFVFDERPVTQPLYAIGRHAAVGASGTVVVHREGRWDSFTAAATQYRAYNLIAHSAGSSIELLDTAWQYQLYTYEDTPTTLQATEPADLLSHAGSPPAPYAATDSSDLVLIIADPDSNQAPPRVTVFDADLWTGTDLLVNAQGDTLGQRLPELPSQFGIVQFDDDRITLSLYADSVQLSARVLRAAPIGNCATSYWKADTFKTSARWGHGDMITVGLPDGDTLQIVNNVGTVTAFRQSSRPLPTNHTIVADFGGRRTTIRLPAGTTAADLARVELFDALGRLLTSRELYGRPSAVALDLRFASRVLYARFVLHDGSRFSMPLLLD
ncbi:MAG: hypothetical protein GF331_00480 [Chitinivibrionales bacterium]|nr:hypothetical protein [Chitinivibrionales bacterium]